MKILFLGGTGRLSKDVAALATDRGNEVYLLTRGTAQRASFVDERYHMLTGDIRNKELALSVLQDYSFDVVVDFLTFNVEQLRNTLDILRGKFRQYIFISTATVYRRENYDELISEDRTPIGNDKWQYAYNKYLCEVEIKKWFFGKKENYTIIRPGVTYSNTRIPYPIVPADTQKEYSFLYRVKINAPIPVFDYGDTEVTITNSKDFAKGVIGLMGNKLGYGEAFHITSSEKVTWGMVLDSLERICGVKINRLFVSQSDIYKEDPYYKDVLIGDKGNKTRYDNSKIISVVPDLSFDVLLEDGLKETVKFYENHPEHQIIDYHWMGIMDRIAIKKHSKVVKFAITGTVNRLSYLKGRYRIIGLLLKTMRKVKNLLINRK
ncbi:MAG TPA: NAD-dependent epimerase/dehydratase family protein [Clostridiaceae bacterium]|nr:NAD-dependent epimerase/dehydratase family protein [Clostridiaceae bacterium]